MPAKRLSMRKIREILRLHHERGLSNRAIARSVAASPATVSGCLLRAKVVGLGWPLEPEMDDTALENLLYPVPDAGRAPRAEPDFETIHKEMRRKGVTLQLLWQEYKLDHPDDGYQYSRFCERYKRWRGDLDVVMRQRHRAGEKMFSDFSGDGIPVFDRETGEVRQAELFVAVLGASCYTYAEAFETQQLPDWVAGHIHAYEYFGGVPEITVPDQPRTAVSKPSKYEPVINPTFLEMAQHYRTAIIPARPAKPRDKAKVENAVLIAQRWIIAPLRNQRFFSLAQVNEAVAERLELFNGRKFQKLDTTRVELFEALDKPALQGLPARRYEYADWLNPRVNIDYHVEIERHYYSVPYQLVHKKVEARCTTTTIEIFYKRKRVASHRRSYHAGGATTAREHMPKAHQRHAEWTPSRILTWAGQTGPATRSLAEKIMQSRKHPEQGYRSCLGLLRLGKTYGSERLEAACGRALAIGARSYQSVKSILKTGLDRQALPDRKAQQTDQQQNIADHENIRGSDYYH
jgi:transposase